MEKFYTIDIRTLPDPKAEPAVMRHLPKDRQEKCLRFVHKEDRQRSLGAGNIINQILTDFNCKHAITEGRCGKPETDGIFFNISHSGDYVIGVASDTPIGCDIEKMRKAPIGIADRFFCNGEKDYILGHKDRDFAFWQLWTLKESYMKMTGEGMSLPLDRFCIDVGNNISIYRDNIKQNCICKHFIYDGHSISVCRNE